MENQAIAAELPPRRVFLCHSSADKARVRALYDRLVEDGFSPWLDEADLLAGQRWELATRRAVRESDFVAVCLSRASTTTAGYVHKEISFALDVSDEQPEDAIFVIPVRLEECQVPDRLSELHWVDLYAREGYARLTRVLRRGRRLHAHGLGAPGPNDLLSQQAPRSITEDEIRKVLARADDPDRARQRVEVILERALNYRHCVRELHESLDVPDDVIAEVAGVEPRTVRRWRSSDTKVREPRGSQARAIERLRRIALVLIASGTFFDLRGIGVWLQGGRESLGWRAPYELLASDSKDGFDIVLREAERFVKPGLGAAAGFGPPRGLDKDPTT